MDSLIISRKAYFSASRMIDSKTEGANFVLEAFVKGPINPNTGLVINLSDLDRILKEATSQLDHKNLSLDFSEQLSRPELLAKFCFKKIKSRLSNEYNEVSLVKLQLSDGNKTSLQIESSD